MSGNAHQLGPAMADDTSGAGLPSGPSPSPGTRGPRNRRPALIAIAIAAILIAATFSGYAVSRKTSPSAPPTSPYPPPPADWATFHTAWSTVSQAFGAFAEGNWTIKFAEGAAADGPWSPSAVLWDQIPPALWDPCAAQLSGISTLTFWNASAYPYSDSPDVFSSGAAPLWTFIFNGTGTPTFVASWLAGHVLINGDLGTTSPCFSVGPPLNDVFAGTSLDYVHPSTELDSNAIASAAIAEEPNASFLHVAPVPSPPSPAFALYFPGPQSVPVTIIGPNLWVVDYGACGLPGQLSSNFTLTAYEFDAATASGGAWSSIGLTCADSYYVLNMSRNALSNPPSSSGIYREWNLSSSFLTSAVPATWTASDLTTSIIHWWVVNGPGAGATVPSSAAVCGFLSANLSKCTPPSSGWYAVLLSANGTWLDSYPTITNGTMWAVAGVHVADGDRIVLVGSAALPTTADFRTTFDTEPTVYAGAIVGSS
jgi:hypothetical protein